MEQLTEYERDVLNRLCDLIEQGRLTNNFIVANLQQSVLYLNLTRVEKYSKQIGKSNWGVRKYYKNKIIKICDYQLVINNK